MTLSVIFLEGLWPMVGEHASQCVQTCGVPLSLPLASMMYKPEAAPALGPPVVHQFGGALFSRWCQEPVSGPCTKLGFEKSNS